MKLGFPIEIRIKINGTQELKEVLKMVEEIKKESTSIIKATIEVGSGN